MFVENLLCAKTGLEHLGIDQYKNNKENKPLS